jgi:hypothetical protein
MRFGGSQLPFLFIPDALSDNFVSTSHFRSILYAHSTYFFVLLLDRGHLPSFLHGHNPVPL